MEREDASPDYRRPLSELDAVQVPFDEQVEQADADLPREYLEPEDYDRLRLLNDPSGSGRLRPR